MVLMGSLILTVELNTMIDSTLTIKFIKIKIKNLKL